MFQFNISCFNLIYFQLHFSKVNDFFNCWEQHVMDCCNSKEALLDSVLVLKNVLNKP